MASLSRYALVLFLVVFSRYCQAQQRVLFLGNSITYDGRYIVDLETCSLLANPDGPHDIFMNLGLPSETVSGLSEPGHAGGKFPRPDLHERLARVLAATKPDVVVVDYGMNDGIYLPLDSARFAAYKNGMIWLHDQLTMAGVKEIYILTPPVHDDPVKGLNGYDLVLDEYSRWLLEQRKVRDWAVGDLHFPMKDHLKRMRKKDPSFKLSDDGVHPNDMGHWIMAREIINGLATKTADTTTSVFSYVGDNPKTRAIHALVEKRQTIMKDAWLKRTGFIRPDMPEGLPFDEAEQKAKDISEQIGKLLTGK